MKKKNIKVNEKKLAIKMILCLVYLVVITILFMCAYRIFEKEQEIPSWTNVESVDDYTYMTIYKMSEKFAYYKDADIGIHFIIEKEETGQWHTYIIAIKESDYNKYKPIIDYTYERTNIEPEPTRVYGYPVNTSEELKELAIKNIENFVPATNEVKINKDNYEAYLTNSYLDTTQKRKDDFSIVLFATLFLLFIVIMLFIFTIFDNGRKQDNILKMKKEAKKMKGKTALLFILTFIVLSFTINVNAETIIENDNKKYCIDDNENIVTGFVEIDGSTYFFSNAKEIYGQMKYGWQDDGTNKFYLDEKTGVLQRNGLFEYKNKKYYANEEGYIQGGPIEIDGNVYFFSRAKEIYGQMKYGWQDDGTNKFYLDEKTGVLQRNGLFEYNKKKYYSNEEGYIQGGPIEIDENVYFFSRAKEIYGQMKYGWQDDGTHKFYLDEKTGVLQRNGLFEYKNKKYYANEEGYIQGGPIEIDGNIYFFSRAKEIYGQMKYGWQDDGTHKFYLDEKTGKLQKNGLFEYKDKKYYANEEGYIQGGPIEIDGNIYFFSRAKEIYGQMKYGMQDDGTHKFYLDEKTGKLQKNGLFEYKNKKYYANEEGYIQGGPIEIDGNVYFFSRAKEIYGQMKYGMQDDGVHKFYLDDQTGILQKGGFFEYKSKKYYANEEGYIQGGFIRIDGKLYFFSRENRKYGQLKYGWQKGAEGIWYQDEEGIVNEEEGLVVIKNKEYYFKGRYAQIGIVEIDGKRYYFNTSKYNKEYGEHTTKYVKYYLDETTGEIKRIQRIPIYYNQKDDRWRYVKIGNATFGSSGCVPTSIAMAFSSIKEREILPLEIGYYLYENTDQFNRRYVGASGMAIIYASNKYGVKYKNIYTKESLKNELNKGNIVYGTMQNGKFARPNWNHAIIIYDYDESNGKVRTIASDPLDIYNNGWVDVDLIWNEKNTDPDDLTGGSALYSLT